MPSIRWSLVERHVPGLLVFLVLAGCGSDTPTAPTESAVVRAVDPTVTSTNPAAAKRDTTLDVQILGSGFDRGSRVDFTLSGVPDPAKIRTHSTTYATSSKLIANITISADAPLDRYDVLVTVLADDRGVAPYRPLEGLRYHVLLGRAHHVPERLVWQAPGARMAFTLALEDLFRPV
jgi:hypothetical protein